MRGSSVLDPDERTLRDEHLRNSLKDYTARTVPALDIDAYAEQVYQANRASEG